MDKFLQVVGVTFAVVVSVSIAFLWLCLIILVARAVF